MPTRTLGCFAKHWTPGQVKTRLAARIGAEAASRLHRLFLETTLARWSEAADRRLLAYAPPERRAEFAAFAPHSWTLWPQPPGDLGWRMRAFFDEFRAAGPGPIVLIGADSPHLPRSTLDAAFASLAEAPVVLVPATDGGYCLLGVAAEIPPLFDGIPWSRSHVLEATLHRLREHALPYRLLPECYDIDESSDLDRLRRDLAQEDEPPLIRLREGMERVLRESEAP